jgi:hypothetical protein
MPFPFPTCRCAPLEETLRCLVKILDMCSPLFGVPSSCSSSNKKHPFALGAPLSHKPFLLLVHPSPRLATSSSKCALPPRMRPCPYECVLAPRMRPLPCKCTLHNSLCPPSSSSQAPTLVHPSSPQECAQEPPNPHSLFLFTSFSSPKSLK